MSADEGSSSVAATQDDADMKSMMHRMMQMVGNSSAHMQSVKSGVTEAKETAKTAVTIARDTEKQVSELQKQQLTKDDVHTDDTLAHRFTQRDLAHIQARTLEDQTRSSYICWHWPR